MGPVCLLSDARHICPSLDTVCVHYSTKIMDCHLPEGTTFCLQKLERDLLLCFPKARTCTFQCPIASNLEMPLSQQLPNPMSSTPGDLDTADHKFPYRDRFSRITEIWNCLRDTPKALHIRCQILKLRMLTRLTLRFKAHPSPDLISHLN